MSVTSDLAKLRQLSNVVHGPLRFVLMEVLALTPLVIDWINVNTSGSAVCRYSTDPLGKTRRTYEVRYQFGNLGNLVHELTHVAVNESYGLDFINYPNWHVADVPARTLDLLGRCTNEELRQGKQMSTAMNTDKLDTLQRIKAWSDAATELSIEQRNDIGNKLVYGMMNPHKESDTVLNQVLVWLFEWGYPTIGRYRKKPVVNALLEELSTVVKNTYDVRNQSKTALLLRETTG